MRWSVIPSGINRIEYRTSIGICLGGKSSSIVFLNSDVAILERLNGTRGAEL